MGNKVAKPDSPALAFGDALPTPADLEGWDSDDVEALLDITVTSFRERRLVIGLLLWKYRALNVDAVYSVLQAKVAQDCDVDARTLQRWRVFAETKWQLPPPDRRTAGKRAAVQKAKGDDVPGLADDSKGTTSMSSANSREQTAPKSSPAEVLKPDVVHAPALDSEPPPKPAPKATQLSMFEEREGRLIVPERPPRNREEVAEAKRIAKAYLDWAATAEFDAPKRATKASPPMKAPKPSDCPHPIGRRIDGQCAVCFAKVGAK